MSRRIVISSPFTFDDPVGVKSIEWFANANVEDREAFLHAIGGDQVSELTWYVHPDEVRDSDHLGTLP